MKYLFLMIIVLAISCKAQTVSLETAAQCATNTNCPDYTYAKDINNSLDKYVGHWIGISNGITYEVKFNKNLYEDSDMKRDRLKGRIRITSQSSGGFPPLVVFDNLNESDDSKTNFSGLNFQPNLQSYLVSFVGSSPEGCINYGTVYLTVNPGTPNQMSMMYWSDHDIVQGHCPAGFIQTFPEKQVIHLTKQ